MRQRKGDRKERRWCRSAHARRQETLIRADRIRNLKSRGSVWEALEVEHGTIEQMLQDLKRAIFEGATGAQVIETVDMLIDFCKIHFQEEEAFMRQRGDANVNAHAVAHKQLLNRLVSTRLCALDENLSLGTLDAVDVLHDFRDHVKTYDRCMAVVHATLQIQVQISHSA